MFYFRKLIDENEVELVSYVKQYLVDHQLEDIKIHVGCDSQNIGPLTHYATTVVFHIGNSGCHFIYKKEKLPKIEDMWTKLWGETSRSVEIANHLKEHGIHVNCVYLDLIAMKNKNPINWFQLLLVLWNPWALKPM